MRLFCIEHQKVVEARPLEFCPYGHEHCAVTNYEDATVIDIDFCCFEGGYTFVPPPEEFFLVGHADLPTPEEIEEINRSVDELLTTWL